MEATWTHAAEKTHITDILTTIPYTIYNRVTTRSGRLPELAGMDMKPLNPVREEHTFARMFVKNAIDVTGIGRGLADFWKLVMQK